MSKRMFVAPFLSSASGAPGVDIPESGGMVVQSTLIDTLVVELPDGTEVIANEFGDVLDELAPEIAETTELDAE